MIITGLTGGIGHGKTTFANLLADQSKSPVHFESWELVAEVASALRNDNGQHPAATDLAAINEWLHPLADAANTCMHVELSFDALKITEQRLADNPEYYTKLFEYLRVVAAQPDLESTEITEETKQAFRSLLQWLGGYLVVVAGSGIWYDEIMRRIVLKRNAGFDLVTVGGVRYPADAERLRNTGGVIVEIVRPDQPLADARDLTERERDLIHADCVVTNNGTLAELASCAERVYQDLVYRQLKPHYVAAQAQAQK